MLLLSYAWSFATRGTAVRQEPLSCALSRVCSNSRPSSQRCCLTISSLLPLPFCFRLSQDQAFSSESASFAAQL